MAKTRAPNRERIAAMLHARGVDRMVHVLPIDERPRRVSLEEMAAASKLKPNVQSELALVRIYGVLWG